MGMRAGLLEHWLACVGLLLAEGPLCAAGHADAYGTRTEHVWIKSWDAASLSGDARVPAARSQNELFPVVIFANSWACSEMEYIMETIKLAELGYLVLEYATRGWWPSSGTIQAAGRKDQLDTSAVIDYVLSRKDWQPDPNKIALAGISYGAGLALLGAAHDPRVTTALAMSGWPSIESALFHNGSPNLIWGEVLVVSGELLGHLDPSVPAMWKQVLHGNESGFHDWAAERSVETFMGAFEERPVPLFLSSNMEDRLFSPEDMFNFFERYPGPKKLLLNQGIHATAEIGGLADLPWNHIWNEAIEWLNHYLKGTAGLQLDVLVDVQLRSDKSVRDKFYEWPSKRIASLDFEMGPRGVLGLHGSLLPPAASARAETGGRLVNESISFSRKSGFNAGFPIIGEALQVFVDSRIASNLLFASKQHAIWYYTPLARKTRICGTPVLSLDFTPSASTWQLVAYLWAVNWADEGTLISHGTVSCWNCTAGERITREIQLRTLCEDVSGGLGLGLDLFSELYQPANTDGNLKMTFHYSTAFGLKVPEVLIGSDTSSEFAIVV